MKKTIILSIIVLCAGLTYFYPHAMLNPGKLVQAHQSLHNTCNSCHTAFSGIPNAKCISCHALADIGKDTTLRAGAGGTKILFHQQLSGQSCVACHTDHKGVIPATLLSGFKHDILSQNILTNCVSCHNKPADNMHKQLSTNCISCHTPSGWKSGVVFNHDMIQGVDKTNCISCHQQPTDATHQFFTGSCSSCHSTSKWVPSSFDHSKYFQLDQNHNTSCKTCHTSPSFKTYSCYGCHEHSESNIFSKHNEEGIYNFNNCVSCHRSGNEHEGRNENGGGKKEGDDD